MKTDYQAQQELAAKYRGRVVTDAHTGRVGELMDVMLDSVWLRPPSGGIEWDIPIAHAVLDDGGRLAFDG